ncbi:AAA family ATPase [Methanomethylophilus alvi]|uniref:AAA family ATPase n=1 Tax=Methanomethylophilus alvi TaxID=1291540 RepID=UPI0037DBF37A
MSHPAGHLWGCPDSPDRQYDNPINNAFDKKDYDRILDFLRNFYSATFKSNECLNFAVMTGVMQITTGTVFSGLNNLKVNNIFTEKSDERYGFTDPEVQDLCAYYGYSSLTSVTIPDSVSTVVYNAFDESTSLTYIHDYSATYIWAAYGSSCTVHLVCANNKFHNRDFVAKVTSSVKIQPTETTRGTTEYSVSGTHEDFAYYDTKDIQDIPATGGGNSSNGNSSSDSGGMCSMVIAMAIALICSGVTAPILIRFRL